MYIHIIPPGRSSGRSGLARWSQTAPTPRIGLAVSQQSAIIPPYPAVATAIGESAMAATVDLPIDDIDVQRVSPGVVSSNIRSPRGHTRRGMRCATFCLAEVYRLITMWFHKV